MMALPLAASGVNPSWLQYANQGAKRNEPLSSDLVKALGFLPEMGITMKVFSGGQSKTSRGRTGSHRHDGGNSGDVFLYKDGRKLDWRNPNDIPLFQDIVRRGKAAGITGFGAGKGYMLPGSMHIGFGNPAVWGAGGNGANAPGWLVDAYKGGGAAPQAMMQSAVAPAQQPSPSPAPQYVPRPAPKPAMAQATPSPMGTAMTGFRSSPQPMNMASAPPSVAPSQAPATGMAFLQNLFKPKEGGNNIGSGMMGLGASMMGQATSPQQSQQQTSFVVPAAAPGMLNPTPPGQSPDIAAILQQLLANRQEAIG